MSCYNIFYQKLRWVYGSMHYDDIANIINIIIMARRNRSLGSRTTIWKIKGRNNKIGK